MNGRRIRRRHALTVLALLVSHDVLSAEFTSRRPAESGFVIVDGPWADPAARGRPLTQGSEGLVIIEGKGFLTLRAVGTDARLLLEPDPEAHAQASTVWNIKPHEGKLYIGYGDYWNNLGPVDIVSYDPMNALTSREMADLPEERLGGWAETQDGRLLVSGQDSMESWKYGSFYIKDGPVWRKKRTVPRGLHVWQVIEFKGRLYANYSSDQAYPENSPHVLVSNDSGASWSAEVLDNEIAYSSLAYGDLCKVRHSSGDFLYVSVLWTPEGSDPEADNWISRLYRSDGTTWEPVDVKDPAGRDLEYLNVSAFRGNAIVTGWIPPSDPYGAWTSTSIAVDETGQQEIGFLRNRYFNSYYHYADGESLYYVGGIQVEDERPATLFKTRDLQSWENLGPIGLPPGLRVSAIAAENGRVYFGASSTLVPWLGGDRIEFCPVYGRPLEDASLHWKASVPEGAGLAFQVRTCASNEDIYSQPWVGPDNTADSHFTSPGQALSFETNSDTFWQVAVIKSPSRRGESPTVDWVRIQYGDGTRITSALDRGPGLYAGVNAKRRGGFVSSVFTLPAGQSVQDGKLFFSASVPRKTRLRFQLRSGFDRIDLENKPFVGPCGSAYGFYETTGQSFWTGHNGDSLVQYRVLMESDNPVVSPTLRRVSLSTRTSGLAGFSLDWQASGRARAGTPGKLNVVARSAEHEEVRLNGPASLSAVDADSGVEIPVHPTEIRFKDGRAEAAIVLEQAVPTLLCVEAAHARTCSEAVNVGAGAPAVIELLPYLEAPRPNWSPVAGVGQPFTLGVSVRDRFQNVVSDYRGTVLCHRYQVGPEEVLGRPYAFEPSDEGTADFVMAIDVSGEWNIVCQDTEDPTLAGTVTVTVQ